MAITSADYPFMAQALRLAERGLYTTMPNPRVGCVLVKSGEVVAEGWHIRAGEGHAEVNALVAAGERARGATAYVTLEPCSHTGKTGPCSHALVDAGVVRDNAWISCDGVYRTGNGTASSASLSLSGPDGRVCNAGECSRRMLFQSNGSSDSNGVRCSDFGLCFADAGVDGARCSIWT